MEKSCAVVEMRDVTPHIRHHPFDASLRAIVRCVARDYPPRIDSRTMMSVVDAGTEYERKTPASLRAFGADRTTLLCAIVTMARRRRYFAAGRDAVVESSPNTATEPSVGT
jgi:hypothetical protein